MQTQATSEVQRFMDTFLASINMSIENKQGLIDGLYFAGPDNTVWRLIISSNQKEFSVQPELMLPMSVLEMQGQEILRMFAVQAYLFSEMNWWLSATEKGFLQLTSVIYFKDSSETIAMLDIGQLISSLCMQYILHGEAQ
jgi:hypothetical protein